MTKVSILVAVYNGERHVEKCLRSLVAQTYENIEIVCIDDCSTDKSVEIIEQMKAEDNRIKLLKHKENKGAAETRNTGLYACTGDIIGYLDCDDTYAEDTIEKLVKVFDTHDDADCVLYRCVFVDEKGNQTDYDGLTFESLSGEEAFVHSLSWTIHGVYAARAELYRRFKYDTTRRHFSDDNTTRTHYYLSRRVYQSDAPYYYKYNPESISNQVSTSRMDFLAATWSMKQQLIALNCSDDIIRLYETQRMKVLVDCYLFYYKYRSQFSHDEQKYCLNELKTGWESIDSTKVDGKLKWKFGFMPMKGMWQIFRSQEEIYFFLKKITKKL